MDRYPATGPKACLIYFLTFAPVKLFVATPLAFPPLPVSSTPILPQYCSSVTLCFVCFYSVLLSQTSVPIRKSDSRAEKDKMDEALRLRNDG
jgi:hypothetical protein